MTQRPRTFSMTQRPRNLPCLRQFRLYGYWALLQDWGGQITRFLCSGDRTSAVSVREEATVPHLHLRELLARHGRRTRTDVRDLLVGKQ